MVSLVVGKAFYVMLSVLVRESESSAFKALTCAEIGFFLLSVIDYVGERVPSLRNQPNIAGTYAVPGRRGRPCVSILVPSVSTFKPPKRNSSR